MVSGFDASNCSDENGYEIFENENAIITEYSIVYVNTNEIFWEGRVIKIPYSDFPKDPNYLKMICINTKE